MARDERKEHWSADLPKDSEALAELDAFAKDQGFISRSDATRMILIAWAKMRQGKDGSVWPGSAVQAIPQPVQQSTSQMAQDPPARVMRRPLNGNAAAVELD